jgi:hypothetical protein
MWKTPADWLLAFLNLTHEVQEHRARLHSMEQRTRDLEKVVKLLAQEQRHAREIDASAREKRTLEVERELLRREWISTPRRKKRK